MRMIGITGGTGFIGRHLTRLLRESGYHVVIFTRRPERHTSEEGISYCYWNPEEKRCDLTCLKHVEAVVHLAGAGVADKRWTKKRKEEIVKSRVEGTKFLVSQLRAHAPECKTLISASAIGYYGHDTISNKSFTEDDPSFADFLGTTCEKWEAEAKQAEEFLRTVILRFGIVLGKEDGAFKEFAKPLSFGIMPILGPGYQTVSWIHVEDLVNLIFYAIRQNTMEGTYNAVAPNPVSNRQLMEAIAKEKGGVSIPFPVPSFFLRLALGEMSTEILKSATVSAAKLQQAGFTFQYPDIQSAVKDLLHRESAVPILA